MSSMAENDVEEDDGVIGLSCRGRVVSSCRRISHHPPSSKFCSSGMLMRHTHGGWTRTKKCKYCGVVGDCVGEGLVYVVYVFLLLMVCLPKRGALHVQ